MNEMNEYKRMTRLAFAGILLLFLLTGRVNRALETPRFTDDPQAMEEAACSVMKLEVYDSRDNKINTGSGFAAFDPTVLVTACHVIVNMEYMLAYTEEGACYRLDKVLNLDLDQDVALLELPREAELLSLPLAEKPPLRGEKVTAIGCQFGLINLITLGNVSGRWKTTDSEWILFTSPISGGSSGGPLMNDRGEVIGVITGAYEKGQSLNLAAPMEAALALYQMTRLEGGEKQ